MSILDIGAGAAGGLEQLLARQLTEEKLAEEERSNRAREGLTGRQIDETAATRRFMERDRVDNQRSTNQDRDQARVTRTATFRPVGSEVTPQERTTEVAAGIPSSLYKENLPQIASRQYGTVPQQNEAKPGNITWVGTEGQREAQQRIDNAGADAVERVETPAPGGGKTVNFVPKKGIAGKSYKGYVAPVQPVIVQTSNGPQRVDRGTGVASPITEAGTGEQVQAPNPAMVRQQMANAKKIDAHIGNIRKEADQVNAMGMMGPIGGRWSDFLAGKVGAAELGNLTPEQATVLNEFRDDIGFLQSGMAMVHGGQRGGGSIAMNRKMEGFINAKAMDRAGIEGALRSFHKWLSLYAQDPTKAIEDATSADDNNTGPTVGGTGVQIKSIRQVR